ncbi:MFS transporter [Streptacidiphilus monticola]
MLLALGVDRTGSGLWAAAAVLYLTFAAGLNAHQIGLLLGVAGLVGILGSPVAGRLAGRLPVRTLLVGCHLLRLATLTLTLVSTRFAVLLLLFAATAFGDRAARMLEMLFATRVAGERRSVYQALSRSVGNAGYAMGAGLAAVGVAIGTEAAYGALILGDALSFAVAALLIRGVREPAPEPHRSATVDAGGGRRAAGPWRDRRYLRFMLLDTVLCLDASVLEVGLPLWLVGRTQAPHALVPAFLILNTVLVVVLQLPVSRWAEGPAGAVRAIVGYGLALLLCCLVIAWSAGRGAWSAGTALLAAAVLVTLAELMRSVSSWELAVLLAPEQARAAYLGVAGMSQSVQRSAGPPLLTGVVMPAGPLGWLGLGAGVAVLAAVQRAGCARGLTARRTSAPESAGGRAAPVLSRMPGS